MNLGLLRGIRLPENFLLATNSISRVIPWIIPSRALAEWYPALCPPSLPLYGFIPLHRFSFMVMSHSMDVFVPMVMSSFMGLSASINSKHDCTVSPFNSYPVILNFTALLSVFCFCLLCFILWACLPQLSRIAGKSCGFLPLLAPLLTLGKNHPRSRPFPPTPLQN